MWLYILSDGEFGETFENTHWKKKRKNVTNVIMHLLKGAIWWLIWKHKVGRSKINATNVTLPLLRQAIWGDIWKRTVEKMLFRAKTTGRRSWRLTRSRSWRSGWQTRWAGCACWGSHRWVQRMRHRCPSSCQAAIQECRGRKRRQGEPWEWSSE